MSLGFFFFSFGAVGGGVVWEGEGRGGCGVVGFVVDACEVLGSVIERGGEDGERE